MRKLLGKVSVYLDDKLTGVSSRLEPHENNNYVILLTPQEDKRQMEMRGLPYYAPKTTATTLAHEFGHLIGLLLDSKAQNYRGLDAEREAWALAEKAYPELSKIQERAALASDEEDYGQ